MLAKNCHRSTQGKNHTCGGVSWVGKNSGYESGERMVKMINDLNTFDMEKSRNIRTLMPHGRFMSHELSRPMCSLIEFPEIR